MDQWCLQLLLIDELMNQFWGSPGVGTEQLLRYENQVHSFHIAYEAVQRALNSVNDGEESVRINYEDHKNEMHGGEFIIDCSECSTFEIFLEQYRMLKEETTSRINLYMLAMAPFIDTVMDEIIESLPSR